MRRLPAGRLVGGGAVLLAVCLLLLWFLPSPDYLFLPNRAQPLDGRVTVEGGKRQGGPGGIYYLDVTVRKATWLEQLLAFVRPDGASLVAGNAVVPRGSSFAEEHRQELVQMDRSERVAAAVALRQAGFRVSARPTGVLVELVDPDVPAASTLRGGDVIVSVDGKPTLRPVGLRARLALRRPGDLVVLRLHRGGQQLSVRVKTVADPSDHRRALIGIKVAQAADIKLPIKVSIDLGGVGGPSAGLPFALDVLERLGKDIDRGYKVAATGELDLDGSVAPIGGVKQKAIGARKAGIDVLLVPAGENARVAGRYAGGVRIIAVETFPQALARLARLPPKS